MAIYSKSICSPEHTRKVCQLILARSGTHDLKFVPDAPSRRSRVLRNGRTIERFSEQGGKGSDVGYRPCANSLARSLVLDLFAGAFNVSADACHSIATRNSSKNAQQQYCRYDSFEHDIVPFVDEA